jgi:pyruvate-formate lyase-activating enzyme
MSLRIDQFVAGLQRERICLDLTGLFPYGLGEWKRLVALGVLTAPYVTSRKLANVAKCELERFHRATRPKSLPYVGIIDVSSTCNLKCPYCPTGNRRHGGRSKVLIDVSSVQSLIDEMGHYLVTANLYNWGEPLLHPEIAAMVELCHKAGIATIISSNLNTHNGKVLEDLCDAGLDLLVVSLSGASQDTYEQYHRGGSLERVIENTRRLIDYRRRLRVKRPFIEWKYLVFSHNAHEVATARAMARKLGVDVFRPLAGGGPEPAREGIESSWIEKISNQQCVQLWHAVVLQSDGGVAPCCYLFFKEDDFGDYPGTSIADLRENPRFALARKLFNPSALPDLPAQLQHPCLKCHLVHRQRHLKEYLRSNPFTAQGHRTGGE